MNENENREEVTSINKEAVTDKIKRVAPVMLTAAVGILGYCLGRRTAKFNTDIPTTDVLFDENIINF